MQVDFAYTRQRSLADVASRTSTFTKTNLNQNSDPWRWDRYRRRVGIQLLALHLTPFLRSPGLNWKLWYTKKIPILNHSFLKKIWSLSDALKYYQNPWQLQPRLFPSFTNFICVLRRHMHQEVLRSISNKDFSLHKLLFSSHKWKISF